MFFIYQIIISLILILSPIILILGVPTLVPGMSCITKTVDINNISFLTFNNT